MVRAWLLFSSLVLGVCFKLWLDEDKRVVNFPFSEKTLPIQSWVYFSMEHLIALMVAVCLIINDDTPRFFFWLFGGIIFLDLIHYILFFRDEGIGWNLVKALIFGLPLLYVELKRLWHYFS